MSQTVAEPVAPSGELPLLHVQYPGLMRELLRLALPVLAEHALHIVVGLNDTYLANKLPTNQAEAAAAVGNIGYIFWFMGLFAGAIGSGSTAIIAREVGAGHRPPA